MRLKIFFSFYCLFSCFAALAQKPDKAARLATEAIELKTKKQTDKACKKLEEAIEIDPVNGDNYGLLGQWYFDAHKFNEAADVFRKATKNCRNGNTRFAKPLARCLIYANRPDGALLVIENYATVKEMAEWNHMKAQAEYIKKAMVSPVCAPPVNLGIRINSPDPELFPSMGVDSEHLFFTRRVNNMDEDFYRADWDTVCGGWLYARNLGSPPNSPNQEASQSISSDGHYLFFSRCENRSEDGWAEGGCDLYMAYRVANDSPWTVAQQFGATINTPNYEGMPSTSADCHELFFVSDRPGGYGGYDIWISRFQDGLWQLPVNAGPEINTAGNETAPYMNLDDNTLYFTSDGWPGMGGSDIFVTRRKTDTTFEKAVNLGYPINTPCDEKSECVSLDGRKLYFASDRGGPAGNYDIYEADISSAPVKPIPVSYIKGVVYDSLTKIRLNYAEIYICDARSGETIYKYQSNRGDASFILTLHLGNKYAIHTQRIGYTDTYDTISFDRQYLQQPLEQNIVMLPSDYVKPVNDSLLATIHFDVNKVELSDSDKTTISNALSPWLQDKAFMVFVNAYTDNTGTPMINEELSTKRAAQVSRLIESMGVDETMLQAKGWGESKMIASNETPDGQRKNRRVEIVLRR